MSRNMNAHPEREDIEMLLPWYVTGRLDRADAARVEAGLARDADLLQQVELARDECQESVLGNEAIGARPASNADRLLAEVERREASLASVMREVWHRIGSFLTPPAGAVRWAGAAAALLIVVQAGMLATMLARQSAVSYAPASGGIATAGRGTVALVGFAGGATASAVADLLAAHEMSIVHGPDAGGFFTVRLGPETMSEAERRAKIATLEGRRDVVAVVIPLR